MKKKIKLIIMLMAMLLSACGSSHDEEFLRYIRRVKERIVINHINRPHCKKEKSFNYPSHQQRNNPFKKKKLGEAKLANSDTRLLNFVGLLKSKTNEWALFSQINGKISPIKLGEGLGRKYGKIIKFEEDSIILEKRIWIRGKMQEKIIQYKLKLTK